MASIVGWSRAVRASSIRATMPSSPTRNLSGLLTNRRWMPSTLISFRGQPKKLARKRHFQPNFFGCPRNEISVDGIHRRLVKGRESFIDPGNYAIVPYEEPFRALDQPTMDAINTYFVSWAAKKVGQ